MNPDCLNECETIWDERAPQLLVVLRRPSRKNLGSPFLALRNEIWCRVLRCRALGDRFPIGQVARVLLRLYAPCFIEVRDHCNNSYDNDRILASHGTSVKPHLAERTPTESR